MHAGRTRFLCQPRDELFHLLADDHHHVGKFVDKHHDKRQRLQRRRRFVEIRVGLEQRVHHRLAGVDGILHFLVEAGQIAHAHCAHQFVAPLHFRHAPTQAIGGFLHVGDNRCQQMRNALIHRQFQHLRVDHQHPHVFGRSLVQQRKHHRVDRHRLARTGGAGDQQMRHARQIGHDRFAGNVFAQRQGQRAGGFVVFLRAQQFRQINHLAAGVGCFQTNHRLARNHIHHAH